MTSMLCVQEPGGFVEHNHKDFSQQILRDSSNHAVFAKVKEENWDVVLYFALMNDNQPQ